MKKTMKRVVTMLLVMALTVGLLQTTQSTTAQAASKIKILKKQPNYHETFDIGMAWAMGSSEVKRLKKESINKYIKANGEDGYYKYKGKRYYLCKRKGKYTMHPRYKMSDLKKGKIKLKNEKLFKGAPVSIKSDKKILLKEGEKVTFKLKVKKGVKIVAIYPDICNYHTIVSVDKNTITIKGKEQDYWAPKRYKEKEPLSLKYFFTYKGKRYYYDNYKNDDDYGHITNTKGERITIVLSPKETEETPAQ